MRSFILSLLLFGTIHLGAEIITKPIPNKNIIPINELLEPNGSLCLSSNNSGTIDLSGYHVFIDEHTGIHVQLAEGPDPITYAMASLGSGFNGSCHALAVDATGVLYAGGEFTFAGDTEVNSIARWNGWDWEPLDAGLKREDGSPASCLTIAIGPNNEVYVGGRFDYAGYEPAQNIAVWEDFQWRSMGEGLTEEDRNRASCHTIAVSEYGLVYAGGSFHHAGGVDANNIALWNGWDWEPLGDGFSEFCNTIAVAPDGYVYAGGDGLNGKTGQKAHIGEWNGERWQTLGDGLPADDCHSIAIGQDFTVYAGAGSRLTSGGDEKFLVDQWANDRWTPLTMDFRGYNGTHTPACFGMAIAEDGDLYIVGNFEQNDGSISNIAKWDGQNWSSIGAQLPYNNDTSNPYQAIALGSDGNIFVAGEFSGIDGVLANDIIQLSPLKCPTDGIVYVRKEATGLHDGSSWENAFNELRDALHFVEQEACPDAKKIWVAAGMYTPTPNNGSEQKDREQHFKMLPGVSIYGGLAGTEAPDYDMSTRNFENNPTILSGDLAGDDAYGEYDDNSNNIFFNDSKYSQANTFILDGFLVQSGRAIRSFYVNEFFEDVHGGGAAYCHYLNSIFKNCVFRYNHTSDDGGAVFIKDAQSAFENCSFLENTSNESGSAVTTKRANTTFTDCLFGRNTCLDGDTGGALYSSEGELSLSKCIFIENSGNPNSGWSTGAVKTYESRLLIDQCTFRNNIGGHGGALYLQNNDNGNLEEIITNSIFEGNTATEYGGAIYGGSDQKTQITNSHFRLNSSDYGAAITFSGSREDMLYNCTFQSNTAYAHGGAIYTEWFASPEIINCTIAGNLAEISGGGVASDYGGKPHLLNTIVYTNWANTSSQIFNAYYSYGHSKNARTTLSNCILQDDPITKGIIGDSGGEFNITELFIKAPSIYEPGNLKLPASSPAIDQGNNDANPQEKDAAGNPRKIGDHIDIGAYEYQN